MRATSGATSRSRRSTRRRIAVGLGLLAAFGLGACGEPRRAEPVVERRDARDDDRYFDAAGFTPMPAPRAGDWLARFEEEHETFAQYRDSDPPGRTKTRRTLVLQPLGSFDAAERRLLDRTKRFAEAYFQCDVRVEKPAPLPPKDARERTGMGRRWTQYRTRSIFMGQLFPRIPDDAIAYLGVTTEDIYPGPKWNYVFGEAYLERRVGVYSLARYFPSFWGAADGENARRLTVLRAFKVLAHETAHMFGLPHCVKYRCNVNGSNSLQETDEQPLALCPECLRKLHWNLGFDIPARYEALEKIYRTEGLADEAAFVRSRLARVQARAE